jgi:hypothetical protein
VDGYANLIGTRLRKLAATGSTGTLPVSGPGDGAIMLRGGQVIGAESSRTPAPRAADPSAFGLTAADAAMPAIGKVAGMLALTEPTIDAATELLTSKSRYAKFRQSGAPARAAAPIPVAALLSEVERRHRVLRQLAPVVTADTAVIRNGSLAWAHRQVSPPQWALVVGIGDGMTPRAVAMELGRSVFATTIEVYRLIELGLLAVPGRGQASGGGPGRALEFTRAVRNEGGVNG